MSKEDENIDDLETGGDVENMGHSNYVVTDMNSEDARLHLGGMYQQWFLDYASYVITDRAIPYIEDGFKPVQRRIMHTMKTIHDGRYNKVANIVGQAMQYHPHGDSSILGALVQIGIPVAFVGTGEHYEDIHKFDKNEFLTSLAGLNE